MSRDMNRRNFYDRDRRNDWGRNDFRAREPVQPRHHSRSPARRRDRDREDFKRRSRSPRRADKDMLDDNILSEISKLPEPSELWDGNHPPESGYPTNTQAPVGYSVEGYNANFPPGYPRTGGYEEFAPPPPDTSGWNQMSLPPPPIPQMPQPPPFTPNVEDQIKKEAAIESEMRHQKAALSKQREDYMKKANILKKELETLKDQRNELRGDPKRSPSPDTKRFLKENTKLQLEIQNKLKTITNVVDMLNGIIGEGAQHVECPNSKDESPERSSSKRRSRSEDDNKKFNYVYYDPEMHWCRVCNEFPPTAKDYLNHLHSAAHNKMAAAHMEAPWHSVTGVNEGFPSFPSAPTKRTPIRGLQFFVPSTAWYCKLCDVFIGDLHCASAHLKSVQHSNNYTNFVEQNPHWETDWMSDRQKAFEKARVTTKTKVEEKPASYADHTITFDKDGFHTTKQKNAPQPQESEKRKKEKKKKNKKSKRSSSSSSSSSSSDSEPASRKSKSSKRADEAAALHEWMVAMQRSHREKRETRSKEKEKTRRSPERQRQPTASTRKRSRSAQRRRERSPSKKPEIRKMPFIGKMPIFKNQTKKTEEDKKKDDETKKKQGDDEAGKRRQQEIDAEIQKKVAEFKEKIAKAQLEREAAEQQQVPPMMMHMPPPMPMCAPAPTPAPPALPQDFQDALDIIFPPQVKKQAAEMVNNPDFIASMQQGMTSLPPDFLASMNQGLQPQFQPMPGAGLLPNPFLPPGVMTQMPLMGFDLNSQLNPQLFQTRPQLYPLANSPIQKNNNNKNKNRNNKNLYQVNVPEKQNDKQKNQKQEPKVNGKKDAREEKRKKEQLDDLAMLGIDASDVGAM